MNECDNVPSLKSDHKIVTLLVHHNSSQRGRGYWKSDYNVLLDDEYISKIKIADADYLLNTTATETNSIRLRSIEMLFVWPHYQLLLQKKKMSMKQDTLEILVKYEEIYLHTTNDIQTTVDKFSFYQNEL